MIQITRYIVIQIKIFAILKHNMIILEHEVKYLDQVVLYISSSFFSFLWKLISIDY